jgi:hypothetical protein
VGGQATWAQPGVHDDLVRRPGGTGCEVGKVRAAAPAIRTALAI